MPELPEVETVVRGLRKLLPGCTIVSARLGKTDFMDDPEALRELLPGKRIDQVDRVGKFIDVKLSTTAVATHAIGTLHLIVHLGMTGQLVVRPAEQPAAPHTHAYFQLDDGRELRYTDIRRFGRIFLVSDEAMPAFRARLGNDPLEISREEFARTLAARHARIKALLLDQRLLRGIGNIYADESLWEAHIHPARIASGLKREEVANLWKAMRRVLRTAIRLRGSSISDYVDANGDLGGYQQRHRVYGRTGKPCVRCSVAIRRIVVAGRGSHYCPRCQPAPRPRRVKRGAGPS